MNTSREASRKKDSPTGLEGVRHIYLVGSGKGGVGKSTMSANIAAALSLRGNRVGILDADIYGPSMPVLLGTHDAPQMPHDERLIPVRTFGMHLISIGNLMPRKSAIAWRGKRVSSTICRFIRDVDWGELDFLIVDLPSGTGDIQITLAEELSPEGAVIITTPHKVSREDVRRCIDMFERQRIPITGLVENMVSWACENCGHTHSFCTETSDRWCEIETIAVFPMDRRIWDSSKKGVPIVFGTVGSDLERAFDRIAARLESAV